MAANSFGENFRITTFGESHGTALGVVIDGCPAGILWDEVLLHTEMKRRRPGAEGTQKGLVSDRNENDEVEVLSGVYQRQTLGTPIAMIVRNSDARSKDYEEISKKPRTGHADDVWKNKFGNSDPRGGGRSSGRETVARVMAGAVAQMMVKGISPQTQVVGYSINIGPLSLTAEERNKAPDLNIDTFYGRFPSEKHEELQKLLLQAKSEGESFGGRAEIVILSPPENLGQPVFHKLKGDLGSSYLSLGGVVGFELGDAHLSNSIKGTEFHSRSEVYGGIRGGISTGETIRTQITFKPTSSILDVAKKGRHDPCIVVRAIPVLEAMTWIVLADHLLWSRLDKIERI
ncbi:MAG TPA: chorismate synthase [Pseudobdellovibrionaceae bacterium]|nr:chorismate synthase [Pseudobdellovibrionaceae bacterium]